MKTVKEYYDEGYVRGIIEGQEKASKPYTWAEEIYEANKHFPDNVFMRIGYIQGYREAIFFATEIVKHARSK